jgi:hypothetical protein
MATFSKSNRYGLITDKNSDGAYAIIDNRNGEIVQPGINACPKTGRSAFKVASDAMKGMNESDHREADAVEELARAKGEAMAAYLNKHPAEAMAWRQLQPGDDIPEVDWDALAKEFRVITQEMLEAYRIGFNSVFKPVEF